MNVKCCTCSTCVACAPGSEESKDFKNTEAEFERASKFQLHVE